VYKKRKLFSNLELPVSQKGDLIRQLQEMEDELDVNLSE
jgi:chromatin remodeling complex protein RSC6